VAVDCATELRTHCPYPDSSIQNCVSGDYVAVVGHGLQDLVICLPRKKHGTAESGNGVAVCEDVKGDEAAFKEALKASPFVGARAAGA
jgi:hypothetical protein